MDEDLRRIERLARAGDPDAIARLRLARHRAGTFVPAVHFVPVDYHDYLNSEGKFDIDKKSRDGHGRLYYVMSPCGVMLWPRGQPTQRKVCRFTADPIEVTCKTCVRSLNAPKERKDFRHHYAPGSFGGRPASPVCQKSDPNKYRETFQHSMKKVSCPICIRVMQKGRRRSRPPRQRQLLEPLQEF